MEQQVNNNAPFLLVQKPQELIALFEGLIDQKIKEVLALKAHPSQHIYPNENTPFLSAKDVQKIFNVSRQTINDWRKSELLQSFKIKSRRFFFKEQVEQLRMQMQKNTTSTGAENKSE